MDLYEIFINNKNLHACIYKIIPIGDFDFWFLIFGMPIQLKVHIKYEFLCVGWTILWSSAKQTLMVVSIMVEFIAYYEASNYGYDNEFLSWNCGLWMVLKDIKYFGTIN